MTIERDSVPPQGLTPRWPGPVHQLDRVLQLALDEDLPSGDVTSEVVLGRHREGRGHLVSRGSGVLAGSAAAARVFALVDRSVEVCFFVADGDVLSPGQRFASASGRLLSLLMAERTALNLLQRLCGIATHARELVRRVEGTNARVVDTRKTTPALRLLEKAAVVAGGGYNHRGSMSDGLLIKTNHARMAGSVAVAVERARTGAPHPLRIEVEVTSLAELEEAIGAGAEICLLDNMSVESMRTAVSIAGGRCRLEASGGIRLDTIRAVAETGVDYISVGALTHSSQALDLAFELRPEA